MSLRTLGTGASDLSSALTTLRMDIETDRQQIGHLNGSFPYSGEPGSEGGQAACVARRVGLTGPSASPKCVYAFTTGTRYTDALVLNVGLYEFF